MLSILDFLNMTAGLLGVSLAGFFFLFVLKIFVVTLPFLFVLRLVLIAVVPDCFCAGDISPPCMEEIVDPVVIREVFRAVIGLFSEGKFRDEDGELLQFPTEEVMPSFLFPVKGFIGEEEMYFATSETEG